MVEALGLNRSVMRRIGGASAKLGLLVLALVAASPDRVLADVPGGPDRGSIEEIPVVGKRESLTVPSVDEARRDLEAIPGGVELVSSEEFGAQRVATLKDVLDYVPGVYVQPKFGEDARFSIRGSGLSRNFHLRGVRLLLDGVPINTSDGSGDFQEIEPLAARYVEVYKGANALRLGASYLGGAVNLVMPSGRDARPLKARVEGGSFGYMRGQLASGAAIGDLDYFGSLTTVMQDGFRDHSGQKNVRFSGNLGYRLSETAETRVYLTYNRIDQEIPGSLTRSAALRSPDDAVARNVENDNKRDIHSFRLASKTTIQWDDATRLSFGGYALSKYLDHPIFQVIHSRYRDVGAFGLLERETELMGRSADFRVGVNVGGGNTDAKRSVNRLGDRAGRTADAKERAFTGETFAEGRVSVTPELSVILGGHYTHAIRSLEDRFLSDGEDGDRRSYREFSPRLGLLWESDPSWQAFLNLSRAAEVPTFAELNPTADPGFADLATQKSVTAEIGARGRADGLIWSVSLYRATLRDELQLFDVGNNQTQARNADRTIHQGLELGLDARLVQGIFAGGPEPDALWLRQAYTYSDFAFDGDESFGGNDLPGAPEHYYRAELAYEHPSGILLSLNTEWVPRGYFVDNANTIRTEDYALLGLRVRYQVSQDLSLFVEARNLLDRKYISSTSVATLASDESTLFNPGEGRAIYAGVEFQR